MASNDQWPPVTSSSLGKGQSGGRKNDNNKNNSNNNNKNKSQQQMVSDLVTEMFQSTLEHDVILSIAENCNWDLQFTIDSLITLSATVEDQKKKTDEPVMSATVSSSDNHPNLSVDSTTSDEFLRMNEDELKQQLEGFNKFEQLKKNSSKNRMDSFRDNISKLDTSTANAAAASESPVKVDGKRIPSSPWKKSTNPWTSVGNSKKKNDGKVWQSNSNFLATNFFTTNNPSQNLQNDYFQQISSNPQRNQDQQKATKSNSNNKKTNKNNSNLVNKRTESELCGLKVHYRQSGTESSSEDDDADVIVEEEYNDYDSMSNIPVNVSQFLSSPVQSSPRSNVQPTSVKPMHVKSPEKSPKKNLHDATVEKIKAAIARGDKIIVLMRGLPGSGKSTEAKNLISTTLAKDPSIYVFSTDDFFQLHNRGVYTYDPTKLSEAHSRNHSRVSNAMKSGRTPIIIDNTNLQVWEMRPYVIMAADNDYIIEVLETNTSWAFNVNELARKNTHGVPKEKIRIMLDRYEKGITGKKLMDIYSLKYPSNFNPIIKTPTQSPTINSTKDELVVENITTDQRIEDNKIVQDNKNSFSKYLQSLALPEVLPEINEVSKINIEELGKEKTDGIKPDDSQTLQPLGAIGSERKNSVVHLDLISPVRETDEIDREVKDSFNILPPCWDFTLLLDGKTLHSNHLEEEYFYDKPKGSPVDADEIRKQDEEFGKEGNSGKVSPLFTEEESFQESEKSSDGMDEFIKELAKEYNETSGFDVKESTVIITEIIDDDELTQLPDNVDSSDEVKKDCVDTVINDKNDEVDKEKEDNDSDSYNEEELHTSDEDVIGDGEFKVKIPWPEVDCIDIDSEFLDDSVDDTIGDESLSDDDAREALNESGVIENPQLNVLEVKDEEIIKEITKAPVTSTIGSIFNIIKTSILGEKSVGEANVDSNLKKKVELLEDDKKEKSELFELQSSDKAETSSQNDEFIEQPDTKELINKNLEASVAVEEDKVDNINSITWKESPFPLDDVQNMKLLMLDESLDKKVISTNDAGTNTSYYDFNVLFVGGTADSNYRVIDVLNRSINEGMPLVQSERPPLKLMLDKSSMTDDMLNRDVEAQLGSSSSSISQLVNLFPNIPQDYLIDMYENLCHKNLSWTVDVLLDSNPDNMPIEMPGISETEEKEEGKYEKDEDSSLKMFTGSSVDFLNAIEVKTTEENLQKTSLNEDLNEGEKQTSRSSVKKNENEKEEFMLGEIHSAPNNKTDTDIFDDISSHSTASASRTNSIENKKSSEDEETVELNLGFDGIRVLENLFSNPDFLIPDGFMPVIQVKKSMAKELYALWIESMYTQLTSRHEQLDNMIAKDAEYAKDLEKQLELEEECASSNKISSNLQESIDLELALKTYNDSVKETIIEDSPDEAMSQLSRQTLYKSLPGIDPKALDEVFNAHGNNLKETFEIIQTSIGRSIATGITKKGETFVDKVKANISNISSDEKQKSRNVTPIIEVRADSRNSPNIEGKSDKTKVLSNVDNAQQEAQRRFSLQIENFNKAAEAYRRGCPAVAAYYSEVSRQHARYNKEARADAASAMVEAQILDNEDILDLHYLAVHDAIIALDTFLDYHSNQLIKNNKRYTIVYIVTGRGSRSTSKMSRIKPAVMRNLLNRNIRFSEANPGCLKVILHRKNGTTD